MTDLNLHERETVTKKFETTPKLMQMNTLKTLSNEGLLWFIRQTKKKNRDKLIWTTVHCIPEPNHLPPG